MSRVYLVEIARKLPRGKRATYYVLRWPAAGKMQEQSLGRAKKSGGNLLRADAEAMRRQKEQDIGTGKIPHARPRRMTLAEFRRLYKERRRRGDADHTRRWHRNTRSSARPRSKITT